MKFSQKVLRMKPSATLAVSEKAKKLKAEGKPVIALSMGEPDFDTPKPAVEAAIEAMKRGETHYTISTGIPELRSAVADYYRERFGVSYSPKEITVCVGAKHALFTIMQTILDEGDEVIMPTPAWVSYADHVDCAGGRAAIVDTSETGFLPTRELLEKALSPRTVAVLVNTPNNPTGAVYPPEVVEDIARFCLEHDLWLIYDEIYERLVYEGEHYNPVQLLPECKRNTVLVNGVSKAYAMTGWRIGYALGPEEFISKMAVIQGHITTNACSVAQWASVGAIRGAEEDVKRMVEAFKERRDYVVDRLSRMPHIRANRPSGAFYVFVDVRGTFGKRWGDHLISDDVSFCEALTASKYVALVPGEAFFAPGFVRISYAASYEELKEACDRMESFLGELR